MTNWNPTLFRSFHGRRIDGQALVYTDHARGELLRAPSLGCSTCFDWGRHGELSGCYVLADTILQMVALPLIQESGLDRDERMQLVDSFACEVVEEMPWDGFALWAFEVVEFVQSFVAARECRGR